MTETLCKNLQNTVRNKTYTFCLWQAILVQYVPRITHHKVKMQLRQVAGNTLC